MAKFSDVHDAADHTGLTGVVDGIPKTLLDAKGDLIAASAADTPAKVTVGSNGSFLRAASGQSAGLEWQLNNFGASTAPGTGDDSGDGYSVGSRWIDTTADKEYVCLDATLTAAVWTETTGAGGSGDVATDAIFDAAGDLVVGTGANTAARLAIGTSGYVLTSNGTTAAWAAAAGGGGVSGKKPVQDKASGSGASGTSRAITLAATPTNGNLLLAVIVVETGTESVSSISQTNVTWTQLAETTDGSSPKVEIWKGAVAASAGTGVTMNLSGATYNGIHVSEWNGLTGTVVDSASVVAGTLANNGGIFPRTPTLLPTSANALVIGGSTTTNNGTYTRIYGSVGFDDMMDTGCNIAVGYAFPGTTPVKFISEVPGNSTTYSALLVSVT